MDHFFLDKNQCNFANSSPIFIILLEIVSYWPKLCRQLRCVLVSITVQSVELHNMVRRKLLHLTVILPSDFILKSGRNLPYNPAEFTQNQAMIQLKAGRNLPKIWPKYGRSLFKIWLEITQNPAGNYLKSGQNLLQIWLNSPKIWPKFTQ